MGEEERRSERDLERGGASEKKKKGLVVVSE